MFWFIHRLVDEKIELNLKALSVAFDLFLITKRPPAHTTRPVSPYKRKFVITRFIHDKGCLCRRQMILLCILALFSQDPLGNIRHVYVVV